MRRLGSLLALVAAALFALALVSGSDPLPVQAGPQTSPDVVWGRVPKECT